MKIAEKPVFRTSAATPKGRWGALFPSLVASIRVKRLQLQLVAMMMMTSSRLRPSPLLPASPWPFPLALVRTSSSFFYFPLFPLARRRDCHSHCGLLEDRLRLPQHQNASIATAPPSSCPRHPALLSQISSLPLPCRNPSPTTVSPVSTPFPPPRDARAPHSGPSAANFSRS